MLPAAPINSMPNSTSSISSRSDRMASSTSACVSDAITMRDGRSSRAASRATWTPTMPAPPRIRLASAAGRGDGLAVDVVDAVARGEDALNVRGSRMPVRLHDVAALVELELPRVGARVRRVADGDEEPLRLHLRHFVRDDVLDLERGDAALFCPD